MNILVVSDSHGLTSELSEIMERHKDHVDVKIHCGDSELSADHLTLSRFHNVQGNMDMSHKEFPNEKLIEQKGIRIFVTHGHLYNVKMSYMKLAYKAEENGADLVCFGHSHFAETFEKDGMIFVNPGSIRLPRGRFEKSYAICEFGDTNVKVRFFNLDGKEITHLSTNYPR
ncbi:metallophosphoesterase family protein [Alkalihalobacillus sp. AL-G]|uniref:metallophosphoesterase family protein n=1 Tax=Alkalihalobacillus sp. AL-G TaxID=2926399 RepID=UPI00272A2C80|nr:metallophosphoesterase [Alkalihalobacillus sp. AL-G]WLD92277.1 metallophosphoesterase [Alkalihalobacillus sp. AL-G]